MDSGNMQVAVVDEESPATLVRLAIEKGVDVAILEKLVGLVERVTERNAERAMAEALAKFQSECPPIPRKATAEVKKNGVKQYEYHFAAMETIVPIIRPILTKNGLSFVHDTHVTGQHPNQEIRVTCVLQHVDGAMRSATFAGPIDSSGGKNPIQMVASTRSYGRRYSLMDVLGLTSEEDTDGNIPDEDVQKIDDIQFAVLVKLKDEVGADVAKFCKFLGAETLRDIPAARFEEARAALESKRKP